MAQSNDHTSVSTKRDCGLSLHRSGQWYKKIRGKFYYFGRDKEAAIKAYQEQVVSLGTGDARHPARESGRAPAGSGEPAKGQRSQCDLRLHKSGQWYKYIRGRFYYFGKDKAAAIKAYQEQATALLTGQAQTLVDDDMSNMTLKELCNRFLEHQETRMRAEEISIQHFTDQRGRLKPFVSILGPDCAAAGIKTIDIQQYRTQLINEGHKPNDVNNHLAAIKAVFRWAEDNEVLPKIPRLRAIKRVQVKPRRDGSKVIAHRRPTFTPEQVRTLVAHARPQMRAMIWLGVNCAFGCTDVAQLRWDDLDLDKSTVNLPRGKTGVERNPNLWPETIEALKAVPRKGPLVFYTRHGNPWIRYNPGTLRRINSVSHEFGKLLHAVGIKQEKGVGFYTLRRTAATVAAKTGNPYAVQGLLGHKDTRMASTYIQEVRDQAAEAVEQINGWIKQ